MILTRAVADARAGARAWTQPYFDTAVNMLRILSVSTLAAGAGAIHCALLYTDRRFAPTAFYQAALNVFTILGRADVVEAAGRIRVRDRLHRGRVGATRPSSISPRAPGSIPPTLPPCEIHWREILAKPAFFVVYAAGLGLNITFTRAYATHAGPGMAAALDYCMRGVGVPMALLVNPISNSLLPEIARLRSLFRLREAFRLIDRTIALHGAGGGGRLRLRAAVPPARHWAAFPTRQLHRRLHALVAAVFLGLGPSLVGWSLLEITARSLFALDRPARRCWQLGFP